MSAIRRILWQRLDRTMRDALGPDWAERPVVLYGAGGLGRSFLQTYPQLRVVGALDSDAARHGQEWEGMTIESPEAWRARADDRAIVFITSSWHAEIATRLESLGLAAHRDFFYGHQQAHGRLFFHLPDMADFGAAFEHLEGAGVEYAILRWFEDLPHETPGDIDLLVRTEHLPALFENPFLSSEPGGVPVEVYWSDPLGQEDELLYYPVELADRLLAGRVRAECGAHAPAPAEYLRSLAYHAVFHKAERSGLPTSGDGATGGANKYRDRIAQLAAAEGLPAPSSLDALWDFLEREGWRPPIDLARRYAITLDSPWLRERVGPLPDAREDVLVYVLRDWIVDRPTLLEEVVRQIEATGLRCIAREVLTAPERRRARRQIRGGNWVESPASREGGDPAAFYVFHDPAPEPPSSADRRLRPFCANRRLAEKTPLKSRIARDHNAGHLVNFLHAADDEREAFEYLACLSPERFAGVRAAIDARGRSARDAA